MSRTSLSWNDPKTSIELNKTFALGSVANTDTFLRNSYSNVFSNVLESTAVMVGTVVFSALMYMFVAGHEYKNSKPSRKSSKSDMYSYFSGHAMFLLSTLLALGFGGYAMYLAARPAKELKRLFDADIVNATTITMSDMDDIWATSYFVDFHQHYSIIFAATAVVVAIQTGLVLLAGLKSAPPVWYSVLAYVLTAFLAGILPWLIKTGLYVYALRPQHWNTA